MPSASVPDDLHEWISFEDPTEERTWVFDVTFLVSPWTCIFARGCQGVLTGPAEELEQGCCSYGAHFIDDDDAAAVHSRAERLTAEQWQHRDLGRRKGVTERADDGTITTRLVEGACIFLNRPGFPGGVGCALHHGAVEAGQRPLEWKPAVCWQLPLRLEEHTDDHGHVTSTLREWKRRDWGPGGSEFHWWCTDDPEAFVGHEPVYLTMRDEIVAMVGEAAYELLVDHLQAREPIPQYLPHPALRRR